VSRRRRSDTQHLIDAVEHLSVLKDHLSRGVLGDVMVRDAVSHRLEVAIDAVGNVSKELLDSEAPEDWPKIVAMRNILAHQYAELDEEILQNTIDNRLDSFIELVSRLRDVAEQLESNPNRGWR
jgi:uncharacterized protein YutE (UPF0331/DUF86 family)